jgi:ABC-type transport system involved in multi-copper enzyme maturation permease subunit
MKQFFAVLSDSYREARDAKIIYVMAAFSILLVLFVGTIHYRPLSMEEALNGGTIRTVNSLYGFQRRMAQPGMALPPVYSVENIHKTGDSPEVWQGSYDFDFVARFNQPSDKEAAKKGQPVPFLTAMEIEMLYNSDQYPFLRGVKVTELPQTPTENRFHVTSEETKVTDSRAWLHEPEILFGVYGLGTNRSIRNCVYYVEKWMVHEIGSWIAILVGVVVTSFFIPNMLRKGTLDLFISKPIKRTTLLIYKYIGGLTFMLAITMFTVGGVWLAIGLSSGIWSPGFVWVVPAMVFYFAILYSVSTLVGVLTRSPILAILVTCVLWGIFWANGYVHGLVEQARDGLEMIEKSGSQPETRRDARRAIRNGADSVEASEVRVKPRWRQSDIPGVRKSAIVASDVLYTALPRTADLDDFTANMIGRNVLSKSEQRDLQLHVSTALFDWYEVDIFGKQVQYPVWLETIVMSVGFIVLMLSLAIWRFVRMDS